MHHLIRESDQRCLVSALRVADDFGSRLRGLIGVRDFAEGQGLLFPRCNSVHLWMMSIPIDVVFLKEIRNEAGQKWKVSSVHPNLRPWKLLPVGDFGADDALELPAGVSERFQLRTGEVLCIVS